MVISTVWPDQGNDASKPQPVSFYGYADAMGDAFGRMRVSNPQTLADYKQIHDNLPLYWDESLESGAGITSAHDPNDAATTITSTASTAGLFTRRSFQRFNYQPGKSQLTFMTGVLVASGGGTGVQTRMGLFDDNNGIFVVYDEGALKFVIRSNQTGTPVDTEVEQSSWNIDHLNGTGRSAHSLDPTKTQILIIDFEWLGVGSVRIGFVINGVVCYAHKFNHANTLDCVYMSTPNLPLTYQMETTAAAAASSMKTICCSVMSEGGVQDLGSTFYASTNGTHVDANAIGTIYAVIGMRLKTTHLGAVVKQVSMSMVSETNDDYEWIVLLNPTVDGTFTYSDLANSACQVARGALANTVTGGTALNGGFAENASGLTAVLENARYLGSAIDGARDEIVLCVRPLSANADIQGALVWREFS